MTPPGNGPDEEEDDDRTRIGIPMPKSSDPEASEVAEEGTDEEDATQFSPAETPAVAPPPLAQPKTAAVVPEGKSAASPVGVGTRINNNYEITHVLKAGGMGEVYRGIELGTGDPVAIKVILPELAEDEKAGQMFKREARTLRQLSDEAIVQYYNYVHDREIDRYCLIMGYIDGVPLLDYTAEYGGISVAAARALLNRLAKGLAKAHKSEVIHRDLSPDNVMLPGGIISEAVLIDFGIAKSAVLKESTMAGQFAGKFKFVSPEQLGHFGGEIGPRSDIYGLALLICAGLLGKPLDMGSSIAKAVESRQSIPDLEQIPPELRPLLAHMLEPDPNDRPASMQDVCKMLEAPEYIPLKYKEGVPLTHGFMGATGTGLAVPPTTIRAQTTNAPADLPAGRTVPPTQLAESKESGGGGKVLGVIVVVFVALMGGALYYAYDAGMIGDDTVAPAQTQAQGTQGLPPPDSTTREGFLAAFDTGRCTYTTRVASGPNAGMIAAMSAEAVEFAGLPVAYEEAFGARPAILPQQITQAQCAALSFARAIQGRTDKPVRMGFTATSLVSGESLTAQIADRGAGNIWAVLISPQGRVFNLTEQVSQSVGGQRTMRFGLSLGQGQEPVPQLVLLVATETPLASAAAAVSGAAASELLPRVLAEIERKGGYASVDLAHLELQPAPVEEPEDEPGPAEQTTDEQTTGAE